MSKPAPSRPLRAGLVPAAALAVAAAVAAVYARGLGGAFLFDDLGSVTGNPTLGSLAGAWRPPAGTTVSGRPFLNLTFALNHRVSGEAPWSYHALNLLIHAAAALLLLGIVRRTLLRPATRPRTEAAALALAGAVALLWALHPLQVDAVGYVVQRAESLMGCLYLATLYCVIRAAAPGASRRGWTVLAVAACLLGMATKEAMVTAPVVILLYDRTFLAGSFREAWRRRRRLYLALGATWIPLAFLVAGTQGRGGTAGWESGVSPSAYAMAQLKVIFLYLKLALWPHPLVGDYGRIFPTTAAQAAAGGAALLALLGATGILLIRRPALGFIGAWFFLILAPSSSVVPVATEVMAEHRMYLPLAAVVVLVVLGLRAALRPRAVLAGVVLSLAAGLGLLTARRLAAYAGPEAFWTDVVSKVPDHAGAWNNLGQLAARRGDPAEAAADYGRALALAPSYASAHLGLGRALVAQGRPDDALPHFTAALRFRGREPAVRVEYGRALVAAHRPYDAADQFRAAAELGEPAAGFDLGAVLVSVGELAPAAAAYGRAVAAVPGYAEGRIDYGNVLAQLGRVPEAIAQYQADLPLEPAAADVRNNLGSLLAQTGRLAEAEARFQEALVLRPDYAEARDNLRRVRELRAATGR